MKTMIGSLTQDLKYAFRTFARSPAFSVAVVLTLAFGIGANSFVFSMMNPYFFRPLPFAEPERLVQLGHIDQARDWDGFRFSQLQLEDYRSRSAAFDAMGMYHYGTGSLTGNEGPQRASVADLSANMFSLLGAPAALGRTFVADEGSKVGEPVVVMAHDLWQVRYGGDPQIIGKTITLDGVSRAVIGIMPSSFVFPFGGVDLWIPITTDPVEMGRDRMGSLIVGRLKPGWTIDGANRDLNQIHGDLAASHPDIDGRFDGISVRPLREALNFAWDILWMMFIFMLASVVFALVLACVNVASLHIARGTARGEELAVRAALGASRRRIVRQLLTESAVLALVGGALGVFFARWGAGLVAALIPEDLYRIGSPSIDAKVIAFSFGITAVAILVFGLAPAINATGNDLNDALKQGGRGGSGVKSQRVRKALVVFETAMAMTLICGMGLMLRSFRAIDGVRLGFESTHQMTFAIDLPRAGYTDTEAVDAYFRRALDETRTVPGVRSVGAVLHLPQNHEASTQPVAPMTAAPAADKDWQMAILNFASPGYFDAMGIPLLTGRSFLSGDGRDSRPVAIVSEALANTYWPNSSPVGRTLLIGSSDNRVSATVVGVVGNVLHSGVFGDEPRPQVYRCSHQMPRRRQFLVVSGEGNPTRLVTPVRQALLRIDANLPVGARSMTAVVEQNKLAWAVSSKLLAVLGAAGMLLACLGIYSVIAYSVTQRRREIGVRVAMGASRSAIRGSFLAEGLKLSAVGASVGLIMAVAASKAMSSLLFGVSAYDPVTLVTAVSLIAGVAAVASILPALRASRIDAAAVLRSD